MRALIFHPQYNTPGRHDADGAFIPGAHVFADVNHIPHTDVCTFDNSKPLQDRGHDVLAQIKAAVIANGRNFADVVAFFCHGWSHGIQAGFDLRAPKVAKHNAEELGLALNDAGIDQFTILLYACSTAEDRKLGFARELFTETPGCKALYAHDRLGHSYKNPYVVRYDDASTLVGPGDGECVIHPGSLGWRPWVNELQHTDRWATFW